LLAIYNKVYIINILKNLIAPPTPEVPEVPEVPAEPAVPVEDWKLPTDT
jgi:hypothetical protein